MVAGVHHRLPEHGPIPLAGWAKSAAGALQCRWQCAKCGRAATNSSRLFEVLRTPCGEPGEWRQLAHCPTAAGDRVECSRCGATRQRHVQLGAQKCPVRGFFRGGAEDLEGTAVYARWTAAVKAMHLQGPQAAAGS